MLKTSGSRRERLTNGRYADERHLQNQYSPDELPYHEKIRSTKKFYNGKINFGPLVRFLRTREGQDWDGVYSEIIERIPGKLMDFKNSVSWFVADKVEFIDGKPWNRTSQKFIWTGGHVGPLYITNVTEHPEFIEFYVHPETNKLVRIPQLAFKRVTRRRGSD